MSKELYVCMKNTLHEGGWHPELVTESLDKAIKLQDEFEAIKVKEGLSDTIIQIWILKLEEHSQYPTEIRPDLVFEWTRTRDIFKKFSREEWLKEHGKSA